jgi:hypothetical protein
MPLLHLSQEPLFFLNDTFHTVAVLPGWLFFEQAENLLQPFYLSLCLGQVGGEELFEFRVFRAPLRASATLLLVGFLRCTYRAVRRAKRSSVP